MPTSKLQGLLLQKSYNAGTGFTRRSNVRSEPLLAWPRKLRDALLSQRTISLSVNFFHVLLFSVETSLVRL
ncbi:hypothetical protein BS78_07G224600 [Paspalum vaginatum]|nr:hypothetical protein BS78_07G224600 [Paspalum vaginatum]